MADAWVDLITSLWAPRMPLQAPSVAPATTTAAPPQTPSSDSVDDLAQRIHDAHLYDGRSDGRVYPWRICA